MGGKKNRFQWQILGLIFALSINAESNTLDLSLKNHKEHFEKIALNLWEVAELGYQEYESSNILADSLSQSGFKITRGCWHPYCFCCRVWFRRTCHWDTW